MLVFQKARSLRSLTLMLTVIELSGFGLNFIALLTRLLTTLAILLPSPIRNSGTSLFTSQTSFNFFANAELRRVKEWVGLF